MSNHEFRDTLEKAVNGDLEALEKIIIQYMPLINKHCYINGQLDEDLRQVIIMHILRKISKFVI